MTAAAAVEVRCSRRWYSTYTACGCPTCRPERARMKKRQKAGMLPPPARWQEAWDVLDHLVARGWSAQAIASAAGMSERGILNALEVLRETGHRRRFGRTIAERIINHGEPTAGHVGATGPMRRLQALAVVGWGLDEVSSRTGLPIMTLSVIRGGKVQRTNPANAAAIAAVYADLAWRPGPGVQAAAVARRRGWVSPLAWDDIDDPADSPHGLDLTEHPETVDDLAVARACGAGVSVPALLRPVDRREAVRRLTERGWSLDVIADHLKVTARTIHRDREALGLVTGGAR